MKTLYTAIFTPTPSGGYDARIPDIPHCFTRGETAQDALDLIQDAAAQMLIVMEDQGLEIPAPSVPGALTAPEGGFTSLVPVDTDKTRMMDDTHTVRKSVSIPAWMDVMARRKGISLSQALQEALRAQIGV